jgi:hypothetical protein
VIVPADALQWIDAIDDQLLPCVSAAEEVRNACLVGDAPDRASDLEVIKRYEDDVRAIWHDDWASLHRAVDTWRTWAVDGSPSAIRELSADVHGWPAFAVNYVSVCGTYSHWAGFEPYMRANAQAAANQHALLEDQLGLFDLFCSRLRWWTDRADTPTP